MKRRATVLLPVAVLLMAVAATANAQSPPAAAYAGPRFPGGPDSLRAYLARHPLPQAGAGPVFVQFDVLPGARRHKPTLILPPGRPPLAPAVAAAALRLVADMPEWSPGRQDVELPITTVTLRLVTGRGAPAEARAYADEMPVFPGIEPGIIGFYRYMPTVLVVTPEIIEKKLTGDVFAYFEVAENGKVENVQIIGGAVPALNNAALSTVARLPDAATTPAQLNGRPVRVYYVLSMGYASE